MTDTFAETFLETFGAVAPPPEPEPPVVGVPYTPPPPPERAVWTLLLMRSPLNTDDTEPGTGSLGELTKASGRKLTFSTEEADTLSFDMPGNHAQTARITPLVDDVLAFRGDVPVQRFRVVTRALSKSDGVLKASFTAVSYRALLDAWIIHDEDQRSWATATEQTDIAWKIITDGWNLKAAADLGIGRGVRPRTPVTRQLVGSVEEGGTAPQYFSAGMKRSEAINNISHMINGFEWSIDPDPANPYRRTVFNTWNRGERTRHTVRSPLVLDDGGSMVEWTHTVTPTDYGNVVRHTGTSNTTGAEEGAPDANEMWPVWAPDTRQPAAPSPEGRWERDINNSDLTTQQAVRDYAPAALDTVKNYMAEITCTLRRGRWVGPTQLWVGDKARLIITEPVTGAPADTEYIVYVDEDVRVVELDIDVDDQGAEDVTLALNRPRFTSNTRDITDRLTRLERR